MNCYFDIDLALGAAIEQRERDIAAHWLRREALAARGPWQGRARWLRVVLPGVRQGRESAGAEASA